MPAAPRSRGVRDIESRVQALPYKTGYHPEILGEYAAQTESRNRVLWLSLLSLVGIFLILHADFGSTRPALIVFTVLPYALIGGVFSTLMTGGVLSLGSIIGFVTVLGIAARNSIMLISHYRHLELREGCGFDLDLIVRGARERLSPILMTALTTALALVPIVVGGRQPGQEVEHPMALVILGGLVSSTPLNLVVMPLIYWSLGKSRRVTESVAASQ